MRHVVKGFFELTIQSTGGGQYGIRIGINGNGVPTPILMSTAAPSDAGDHAVIHQYFAGAGGDTILNINASNWDAVTYSYIMRRYARRRLSSIKLRYVPSWNNYTPFSGAQNPENGNLILGVRNVPMYILSDNDGIEDYLSNITENEILSNITGIKTKSVFRGWKLFHRFRRFPKRQKYIAESSTTASSAASLSGTGINPSGRWSQTTDTTTAPVSGEQNADHIQIHVPISNWAGAGANPAGIVLGRIFFTEYWDFYDQRSNSSGTLTPA